MYSFKQTWTHLWVSHILQSRYMYTHKLSFSPAHEPNTEGVSARWTHLSRGNMLRGWEVLTGMQSLINEINKRTPIWMCRGCAENKRRGQDTNGWETTPCRLSWCINPLQYLHGSNADLHISLSLSAFYWAIISAKAQNTVTWVHCVCRSILAILVHTAAISWIILFVPLWR